LFEGGDAWLPTGDLFRVDADGDHWLIGSVQSLIRTPQGATPPIPVQDVLDRLDEVHLSVAYPVVQDDGTTAVAVAVSLCPGVGADLANLAPRVDQAVQVLAPRDRPRYVRVVEESPRTTWYRVRTGPLRNEGLPADGSVLVLDDDTGTYRPLTG
ncbi:MAG TPA: acyl-CoA synthetase, partial [Acidimicrobiales bacterium]